MKIELTWTDKKYYEIVLEILKVFVRNNSIGFT